MNKSKALRILSVCAVLLAAGVVVMGAYTRLAHAGLGCPDWPTCYGHLWVPDSASEIERANQQFNDTPVETDKTWPEQLHRLMASTLGMVILALFALVLRDYSASRVPFTLPLVALVGAVVARVFVGDSLDPLLWLLVGAYFGNLFLLSRKRAVQQTPQLVVHVAFLVGLVVLQGFFGMWTVTLKLWPQVVTAHLLGGFATLSLLWLFCLRVVAVHGGGAQASWLALRPWLAIALVLVIAQITLGGWTSANYAALACTDLPTCHGLWWPQADFSQGFNIFQHVGPNYLGGQLDSDARTAIHMSHRIGAVLVLLSVGGLIFQLQRQGQALLAAALLASLALQLGLGISNVVFSLPLVIAVAHNAGGALLLLCLLTCLYKLRPSNRIV